MNGVLGRSSMYKQSLEEKCKQDEKTHLGKQTDTVLPNSHFSPDLKNKKRSAR